MAYAERYIKVDGLKTRYLEAGKGPPVILMHGASLGSCANVWDLNIAPIANGGFRVIAYDDPGFGLSDDPADLTVAHRRRFLPQFMDALGLASANVVGHSQAGGIAVQVALDHPRRFTRLLVIGTGSLVPPLPGAGPDEYSEEPEREPTVEDVKEQLKVHVYDVAATPPALIEKRHQMSVGPRFQSYSKRHSAPRRATGGDQLPLWQRLTELQMPFLMLFGLNDTRNDVSQRAQLMKERFPQLRIELLDRCSHLAQWDQPEKFQELAVSFFSS